MDLSKIYSPRPDWVHKGAYGSVLVICGSKLYTGSATLAAMAALRSGCDLVTVCAPQRSADAASHFPDLMTFPLAGDHLTPRHVDDILDIAKLRRINSVVLGCGLGRHSQTLAAILKLVLRFNIPMVLDADALQALATKQIDLSAKQTILTPHAGELSILLHQSQPELEFEARLRGAKLAAQKYQTVVLLKGFIDIITDGTNTITNNSGTPQMTKGGFGDTLAGITASLLARGVGLFESAHVAAFINGRSGELAAEAKGEGLIASDIFNYIPKVING